MSTMEKLGFVLALVLLTGCSGGDGGGASAERPVTLPPEGAPFETLAEWHLFDGEQQPNERVVPYDVVSPLWSDATNKHRFLFVPEGATIGYQPEAVWQLPVGAVLVKTFAYGERLLETRLLVHESGGWAPHTYVWDEAGKTAVRMVAGKDIPVTFVDAGGKTIEHVYGVPNLNLCKECHGIDAVETLGGRTRQLNRSFDYGKGPENQIDHFASLGWLDITPPPAAERETLVDPAAQAGDLGARARSYLEANCAHCHAEGRGASSSGLLLDWAKTAAGNPAATFGVCKTPTSAGGGTCGLTYDIVPGKPEESVLMCRIASRVGQIQMPPIATKLVDDAGVALLGEWIQSLKGPPCQ